MPRIKSFIDTGHDVYGKGVVCLGKVFAVRANGFIEVFDGILFFAEALLRYARP